MRTIQENHVTPSQREEIANAITHGIGALLSIAALVILLMFTDSPLESGYLIFGITLVLLYLASTLYHSITHLKTKNLFRKFDHMAIFLLIAGTYTPFCLIALDGWLKWTLLGIVWGCALLGIVLKSFYTGRMEWLSLLIYIVTGWMVIVAIKPIYVFLPLNGFIFLLLGGLAYTGGTFFYMNNRIRYNHSIWHLFVLAGSIFHFFSVLILSFGNDASV